MDYGLLLSRFVGKSSGFRCKAGLRLRLNSACVGFDLFVQWLNPGRNGAGENYDRLGLMPWLLGHDATIAMRDGRVPPGRRTEEIWQFIHGWAKARKLAFVCP